MTDTETILEQCRELALVCASELGERPLYIVDAITLRGLPCDTGSCLGWAGVDDWFDSNIADALGDRYRGAGTLICLDMNAIRQSFGPANLRTWCQQITLHEMSHVLPLRKILEPPRCAKAKEIQAERMRAAWSAPKPPLFVPDPWHDVHFARRAVHLWFRSRVAGYELPLQKLFGPAGVLADAVHYLPAIVTEAIAMHGESFAAIEAQAPPRELLELWEGDLEFCRKNYNNEGTE